MSTRKIAGFDVVVAEPVAGFRVVSALAHPVIFADGEVVAANPELAKVVKASMPETEISTVGSVRLVRATPRPDAAALETLRQFAAENPGIRVISSGLSVEAFREALPGVVIGPITTPETSRLDNAAKRCFRDKWSC